ncbi:hypothetical protein QU481_08560 [Crenobacter sp. SG2303]|uniref:Uncharacterized protein n=1 Tax=Crenobacter oryzisoli TaxID=3056844 RepID=A0ABT7XMH8_9NEIS|nr:hypothetical protein [Crenobacter sp. SG2303]MDN0074945.1 hypothetical protein [Crenobacter sp. SG2303]
MNQYRTRLVVSSLLLVPLCQSVLAAASPDDYSAPIIVSRPVDTRIAYRPDFPPSTHPTVVEASPAASVLSAAQNVAALQMLDESLLANNSAGTSGGTAGVANANIGSLVTNAMGIGTGSQNPLGASMGGSGGGSIGQTITSATSAISNTLSQAMSPLSSLGH